MKFRESLHGLTPAHWDHEPIDLMGRVSPLRTAALLPTDGAHGVTRPAWRFRKSFIKAGLAAAVLAHAIHVADAAPITALAFSPDGAALVSSGSKSVEVRSPIDGSIQQRISCDLQKITSVAFSSSGQWLAIAGGTPAISGEVRIFDWREKRILHRLTNHTDLATSVAFNADGTLLGVASADHSARVWHLTKDAAKVTEAFTLTGHAGPVLVIAFSPSGQILVTASADRSIKVWSTADGRLLRTFSHHTESVQALAFRPGSGGDSAGGFCASAGDDRTVRIWQPQIGRMVRIIRHHEGPILALAFSPDGKVLYSAGKEGVVRVLDPDSDTVLGQRTTHPDWIYALAVSPDGQKIASGDWAGKVVLRSVPIPGKNAE